MRPSFFLIKSSCAIACAVSLCAAMSVEAQVIGRLFSTPAQRGALDRWRQQGFPEKKVDPAPAQPSAADLASAPAEPVRELYTLDGFVKRSSGANTTWINQMPQSDRQQTQGVHVRQQLSRQPVISLILPSGKHVELKPGQTYDKTTGKVLEVYEPAPVALPRKDVNE